MGAPKPTSAKPAKVRAGRLRARVFDAIARGDAQALREALAAGADPDAKNSEGLTPVQLCADRNRASCLEALAAAGADLDARLASDKEGGLAKSPAVALAARSDHGLDCLRALIGGGADLEAQDGDGWTAAAVAARHGAEACLRALVDAGCDIDSQGSVGWTPALRAAFRGHAGSLKILLDAGCDLDSCARVGSKNDPLKLDELCGGEECARLVAAERARREERAIQAELGAAPRSARPKAL